MKPKNPLFRRNQALAFAAAILALPSALQAAGTFNWTGLGTNGSWASALNWDSGITSDNQTDLVFNTTTRTLATTNNGSYIAGNRTVRSLSYGSGINAPIATSFNFYNNFGNDLTMSADIGNASITVDAAATGAITLGAATGVGTAWGALVLSSNLDVIHNGTGQLSFNRAVTGAGALTKTGSGTLAFTGTTYANTYSGLTTVSAGNLIIFKTAGTDAIAGNVLVNGTGTLTIGNGANQIKNTSNVEVAAGGTFALGTFAETVNGVKLTGGSITGTGGLTSTTAFDLQSGTISGVLAGSAGAIKTGAGTVTLSAFNALTGNLNINEGTLIANTSGAAGQELNTFTAINLNGGTLEIRANFKDKTYASPTLTVSAASTLAYNNTSTTNYNAAFTGTGFTLNADLKVNNISDPTAANTNELNLSRGITGSGNMTVETYNNIASPDSMNSGRVILYGDNTGWSGNVTVKKGSVQFSGNPTLSSGSSGDIIIGETSNTSGAGVQYSAYGPAAGTNQTINNDIFVRAGGFRALRTSSDHSYLFGGGITLDGDLTVNNANYYNTYHIYLNGNITGTGGLNITESGGNPGIVRLTGNNSGWSGNLTIARGTLSLGGNAVNSAGTGAIALGTTADATAAVLTISPQGSNGSTVTYANNITVNTGGLRTIKGGNTDHKVNFDGDVILNGDLTVDHTWGATDRSIRFTGDISGGGGLTITRSGGNAGTTAGLAGTNTYLGNTTVNTGASLAVSGSLTSNITVANGARFGGNGSTSKDLSLASGAKFIFTTTTTFDADGSVTLDNTFGVASLVGGSQGEAVAWDLVPAGTYTLIGTTGSTFGNISNFGAANAVTGLAGGRSAYFQNGGGTGGGGLQLVVTASASGFDAWKAANGNPTGGLGDDHDGDGVSNGVEYFLGGDTGTTGFTTLPGITNNAGTLSVTWTKAATGYAGTYNSGFVVETSDTLVGGWTTEKASPEAGYTVTFPSANEVKYTFPAGTRKFARLKVTGP